MDLKRFEYSRVQMGGQARIVLYTNAKERAESAARAAFNEIERLENILSDWRPRSELSRLSAGAGGPAVKVSRELYTVLVQAQRLARLSDGAFDITVGPLTRLWRESRKTERLPDRAVLRAARERVGWEKLELAERGRTARLTVPGMVLDAGGIAKGYALDRAVGVLRRQGVRSCLLEMGGDLWAGDPPPGERGWRIERDNSVVTVARSAISTSGTGEQGVLIGRRRYAHIVDPRTGLGLTQFIQVSVSAQEGLVSDPLATALCVLGPGTAGSKLLPFFSRADATFWYPPPSGQGDGVLQS
jgi:FAD:protein FMN transferase